MSAITTHVLDTTLGKAAAGITVELEMLDHGTWSSITQNTTDADGRCSTLAPDAEPGIYRLRFSIGAYFTHQNRASIYPEIVISFETGADSHYHLPLLISDNGYTTYRGT